MNVKPQALLYFSPHGCDICLNEEKSIDPLMFILPVSTGSRSRAWCHTGGVSDSSADSQLEHPSGH